MAIVVNRNYTDSTGGTAHEISIPSVVLGTDFRIESERPNSVILTNLTSPIGYPETVKYSSETIADMYAGTTVERALYAASRKGRGILVSLHDVMKVTDSTVPDFELALPFHLSIAFKFLQNSLVTEDLVVEEISRLVGFLFDSDQETMDSRIKALVRGALVPKDL